MSHESMLSAFYFIFGLALAYIIGSLLSKAFKRINEKTLNDQAPVLKIPAVVIEKRVQVEDRTYHGDDDHYISINNEFIIIFEHIHTGARHSFEVREDMYNSIVKDDIGYLTYQRKRFLSFVIDFTAQHMNFASDEEVTNNTSLRIDE